MRLRTFTMRTKKHRHVLASPPKILALGFLACIILGAISLKLPWSTFEPITWFEAFFTATSAVTVTGLSLFNVTDQLTLLGKVIISILVQVGGLGFVTFAILAASSLGRRISIDQQVLAMEAFNQTNVNKLHHTAFMVIKYTLSIQIIAMALLALWWAYTGESQNNPLYTAVFHVSMAFNNAGFMLFNANPTMFHQDAVTVGITTLSIIIGGIGFPVLQDIFHHRRWSRLSVYSKVVIIATIILNKIG